MKCYACGYETEEDVGTFGSGFFRVEGDFTTVMHPADSYSKAVDFDIDLVGCPKCGTLKAAGAPVIGE